MSIGVKSGPAEVSTGLPHPFLVLLLVTRRVNWGSTAAIEPTEPPAPPIPPIISVAAAHQTPVDPITAFDVTCGQIAGNVLPGRMEILEV